MMQITESIINRYKDKSTGVLLVGICGRAGAGKTTLSKKIAEELTLHKVDCFAYSGDWRFILDSKGRKQLFKDKWNEGLNQYLRAINQFTWWDFSKIEEDLITLISGKPLVIESAYNQSTGKKEARVELPCINKGIIFYESNVLGGIEILGKLDIIVVVNTPATTCFRRIIDRDSHKRSIHELAARNIVTSYSENLFFHSIIDKFYQKLLVCDSEGIMGEFPKIEEVAEMPVPITSENKAGSSTGSVLCDLDNTLIKIDEPGEILILTDNLDLLKSLKEQGKHLIALTSHPFPYEIMNLLKSRGLEFDRVVCDLPLERGQLLLGDKWEALH